TTGLDPRTRGQMWDTIRGLVADGCTVLLTTQYLEEADQLADRVAVIDRGRKVAEDTPDALKTSVGESTLQVEVADPDRLVEAAEAMRRVVAEEPVPTPERSRITLPIESAEVATNVLLALRERGIAVTAINVAKPSLEEEFLALTVHDTRAPTLEDNQ